MIFIDKKSIINVQENKNNQKMLVKSNKIRTKN